MSEPPGATMEDVSRAQFIFIVEPEEEGLHQVPAALLGEELLALSALLGRANDHLNRNEKKLMVAVHANPRGGSLEVDLLVEVGTIWEQAKALFTSDSYSTAKEILTVLGIGKASTGVIRLWKKLRGRTPDQVKDAPPSESGREQVTIILQQETIIVEKVVFEMANDDGIKRAGARLLGPALAPGIAAIAFKSEGKVTERIDSAEASQLREDLSATVEPELEIALPTSTRRALLYPQKVWFEKGNKWQLTDGSARYNVAIADEGFLKQVEAGEVALTHLTELDVDIATETLRGPDGLEARHVVTRVHSWRNPRAPRDLFGSDT